MSETNRKIRRIDIFYWFLIIDLIVVVIAVLAWRAKNATEIINAVSVGSGMASILLALVAIVYAFLQTESSSRQNSNLQSTLSHINQKVHELGVIKDDLTSMKTELVSFRDLSTTQNENVLDLISKLQKQDMSSVEGTIEKLREKKVDISETVQKEIIAEVGKDSEEKLKAILGDTVRSMLSNAEKEIFDLFIWQLPRGTEYSYSDILDYLKRNGVGVDKWTLSASMNRLVKMKILKTEERGETTYFSLL